MLVVDGVILGAPGGGVGSAGNGTAGGDSVFNDVTMKGGGGVFLAYTENTTKEWGSGKEQLGQKQSCFQSIL